MNLFEQIINQSKLGTPGQFSGGTSFGSINTQDFQSKAPTIQKSVQAEQNLRNQGFSDKEVKFLKLQKEKGVDMNQAFAFVEQKRKEEAQIKNAPTTFDMTGGAVSQVPKALGETASWMSSMGANTPMAMASAAIRAPFSEKTYGQLREEQKNAGQVFADIGQKGKEAIQSTGLYNPNSTGAKIGETITDIGSAFIGPNKVSGLRKGAEVIGAGKKLTTAAKIGDIALEGGLAGAKYDVATKGEITPESVALGAIGNVGVSGVLKGGKVLAKRYTGANISTRANRFTAGDEEKFIKMTGETPGEFATTRGMTAVGEDAVKQSSQFYKASMDKADEAISKIEGSFSTKGQTDDILGDLMEGNIAKIKAQPRNPDASRINALYAKYESGQGLTMSEINEAKRIYARNHKFTWDQRASDSAVNATNLQNDLRKWQMKLAEESGLENLAEINKTTQAWKSFADSLEKRLDRSGANNLVSLSDWVALSGGNPTNLALFAGKKAFEIPGVKQGAIKLFSKQTKPSIIEPTTEKILKTNLQKKYANPNVSDSVSTISDKSLVRPVALLPAPSGKATGARNIRVNQPKDTSRKIIEKVNKEKVKRPGTQSELKPKDVSGNIRPIGQSKDFIEYFRKDLGDNVTMDGLKKFGFTESQIKDNSYDFLKSKDNKLGVSLEDLFYIAKGNSKGQTPAGPTTFNTSGRKIIKKAPESPVALERGYTTSVKKPIVKRANDIDSGLMAEAKKYKSAEEFIGDVLAQDYQISKNPGSRAFNVKVKLGGNRANELNNDSLKKIVEIAKINKTYDKEFQESVDSLLSNDSEVTIYRAAPIGKSININDYVTLSKNEADKYMRVSIFNPNKIREGYKIYEMKVKKEDLLQQGKNSMYFTYFPKSKESQLRQIYEQANSPKPIVKNLQKTEKSDMETKKLIEPIKGVNFTRLKGLIEDIKSNNGGQKGVLGDFLEGNEMKKIYGDALDTPVYIFDESHPVFKTAENINKEGTPRAMTAFIEGGKLSNKGTPIIAIRGKISVDGLIKTLTEEGIHALQKLKGRKRIGSATAKNFSEYEGNANEINANKGASYAMKIINRK